MTCNRVQSVLSAPTLCYVCVLKMQNTCRGIQSKVARANFASRAKRERRFTLSTEFVSTGKQFQVYVEILFLKSLLYILVKRDIRLYYNVKIKK